MQTGPFGRSVPLVAAIKHAVNEAGFKTPVVATGGITTFEQAEAILQNGQADIVGSRASGARRSRLVRESETRTR